MAAKRYRAGIRKVVELRERLRAKPDFNMKDLDDLARKELAKPQFDEERNDGYVQHCMKVVDDMFCRERQEDQPVLPGLGFDLEGDYRYGDGGRVPKAKAKLVHDRERLKNIDKNYSRCGKSRKHEWKEHNLLLPYWTEEMTKLEAVEAYYRANPGKRPMW